MPDVVSPYMSLCFYVGAHVNEVADNACPASGRGLMHKCPILPPTH